MVVATLVNIVLLFFFMLLGLIVLNLIVANFHVPDSMAPALMLIIFVGAIVLSMFVYSRLVKWATNKYGLEDKMAPLFGGRRKPKSED